MALRVTIALHKSPSDDGILGSFSAVMIRPDPPCVPSGIKILFLNPRIRIKMAFPTPPPNISVGSERVLEPNVRWGGEGCTPWVIPIRGLMAPGILGAQDERSKWGGQRILDVSVLGTVRDHSALRTRSQGQSMAFPVQWGPYGTHRVQFTRPIDTIEHRASKMLLRARTAPRGA